MATEEAGSSGWGQWVRGRLAFPIGVWALAGSGAAWAHGEAVAPSPWSAGAGALFGDPPGLMALIALALLVASPGMRRTPGLFAAAAGGWAAGVGAALLGAVPDPTVGLLAAALVLGALVALGRPLPRAVLATAAAGTAMGVASMLAPAPSAPLADQLAWHGGVALVLALVFGNGVGLLRAAMGRTPGPVRRLLLRVAGSWVAAAALLVLVLEIGQRRG